ncbi:hypothetical protein PMAC_000590 [Pneumocystis sp. 'macacae']|nr:hypothetical protein PMAC_000590 [Pneumocystis sp. 'macacae']
MGLGAVADAGEGLLCMGSAGRAAAVRRTAEGRCRGHAGRPWAGQGWAEIEQSWDRAGIGRCFPCGMEQDFGFFAVLGRGVVFWTLVSMGLSYSVRERAADKRRVFLRNASVFAELGSIILLIMTGDKEKVLTSFRAHMHWGTGQGSLTKGFWELFVSGVNHAMHMNTEYVVISGAKRKNEEWDSSEVGIVRSKGFEQKGVCSINRCLDDLDDDLKNDPFYKVEKTATDINKAKESIPLLSQLYKLNEKQWADPYTVSSRLRKIFREEKKILKMEKEKDEEFRRLNCLSIKLAKEDPQDHVRAKLVDFRSQEKDLIETTKKEIHSLPFFAPKASPVSIHHTSDKHNIVRQLRMNTRIKNDPFILQNDIIEHNHMKLNAHSLKQMLIMTNHKSEGPQGLVSYKSDDSE